MGRGRKEEEGSEGGRGRERESESGKKKKRTSWKSNSTSMSLWLTFRLGTIGRLKREMILGLAGDAEMKETKMKKKRTEESGSIASSRASLRLRIRR